MNSRLFLIQLNEINFFLVNKYLSFSKEKFPNLNYIKKNFRNFTTYAENEYDNLEPWIQWASVQLGKEYKDHGIFRLGDIVNHNNQKQIFETVEEMGFKVGAISPMNADNRLKNPAYFIPDPWTDTQSDNFAFSKRISSMLRQTVNDNSSGRFSIKSILTIFEIFFRTFHFSNSLILIKLVISSIFKPWKKSLILDYLIHLINLYFIKRKIPDFSSVFFNAGAHIQHHYLFNSKHIHNSPKNPKWYIDPNADPIEDMLEVYDKIIGDYIKLNNDKNSLIIATGLQQVPYDKKKFYYRLKNHFNFLKKIGVKYMKVLPRMTRDFEIIFVNEKDKIQAKKILENIKSVKDNLKIFNKIEVRSKSLFITLTYPNEILRKDKIVIDKNFEFNFYNEVVFVAIKNGMHDSKGYVFCSTGPEFKTPNNSVHISELNKIILNCFNLENSKI